MAVKFDIHDNKETSQTRFKLGISGFPKLFELGVNPSMACKDKSDTTITKVETFSSGIGFSGFIMLNVYPQRTTNPDELHSEAESEFVEQNRKIIYSLINGQNQPQIWAAWGNLILKRDYLWNCLKTLADEIEQFHPIWKHCSEPTKLGHPRYPSRLTYKKEFFKFDIPEYLKKRRIVEK
jgi:hypothetical protein